MCTIPQISRYVLGGMTTNIKKVYSYLYKARSKAWYIIQKQTFQICILGFTCVLIQQTYIYNPLYNKALHASITFAWWHRPTVEQGGLLISFNSTFAYMTGDKLFHKFMPHVLLIGYSDTEIQPRG